MKRSMWTTVAVELFSCLAMLAWLLQTPGQSAKDSAASRPHSEQPADATKIEQLIRQLGSDRFDERETASNELDAIGEPALPALRKIRDYSDLEVRRRVSELLRSLTRKRAAERAKAWATVKKLRCARIDSDTGRPDGQIGGIDIYDEKLEEDLSILQWLDEAESLRLAGPQITDAALSHIKTYFRVRCLSLDGTKVTGAGFVHLKELDELFCLELSGSEVTDAGLVHLKVLKSLAHLFLVGTRITDAGLDHVKEMKRLTSLRLDHTKITDVGLAKLKGLNLYLLDLSDTQITDAGLAHLKDMKILGDLNLSKTRITDAGLAPIPFNEA